MPFRAYVYVFIHFMFGWFTNLTLLKKGNKNCPLHGPEITAPYQPHTLLSNGACKPLAELHICNMQGTVTLDYNFILHNGI